MIGAGVGAISGGVGGAAGGAVGAAFKGVEGAAVLAGAAGGAAGGATAGGLNAAVYGGNVGVGMLTGGVAGFVGGAVYRGINAYYGTDWSGWRVGVSTIAGGVLSAVTGGDFVTGALTAFGTSGAAYSYKSMLSYNPDPEPGKDLPDGVYDTNKNGGRPPEGYKVLGLNKPLAGEFWEDFGKQGGAVSVLTDVPGLNAVAGLHDYWMNQPGMPFNFVTNVGTMLPAAAVTYGALAGGHLAPLTVQMTNMRFR